MWVWKMAARKTAVRSLKEGKQLCLFCFIMLVATEGDKLTVALPDEVGSNFNADVETLSIQRTLCNT